MPFTYPRTIHFCDTDAAGVVYFANVLNLCHEAYEASLAASGVDLRAFFGGEVIAVPITHASVDFLRPLFCGDRITIHLVPNQLSPNEFEIHYEIFRAAKDTPDPRPASRALTRHVCIHAVERVRADLPAHLQHWLAELIQG